MYSPSGDIQAELLMPLDCEAGIVILGEGR